MSVKLNQQEYVKAVNFTYEYFDKQKKGSLDKQQFVDMIGAVAPKLGFPLTEELVQNIYNRIDTQQKGSFTAQELHNVLQKYYYN